MTAGRGVCYTENEDKSMRGMFLKKLNFFIDETVVFDIISVEGKNKKKQKGESSDEQLAENSAIRK